MTVPTIIMLCLLPPLLVASAFFSGSETALFSLSRHERRRLAQSPRPSARAITTLLSETRALLITLLMGNMTVNVAYFVLSSVALLRLGGELAIAGWVSAPIALLPLLGVVLFGEVFPKLIAARLSSLCSRLAAFPLLAVHRLLTPVRVVAEAVVIEPASRLMRPSTPVPPMSTEELDAVLHYSQTEQAIDPAEQRMLSQIMELSRLKVRDLMVPRVDIEAFNLADPPGSLIAFVKRTRLRHIPVFRRSIDHIEGLVYGRQVLLRRPTDTKGVERLIRQVRFIPEQQRADRLLVEMRKTGQMFAIVVDEYGGTAGLITLEDLVEHLVGDIPGAFERSSATIVKSLGNGRYRVSAGLMLIDWPDQVPLPPPLVGPLEDEEVSTVGGLVMSELGHVPAPGDEFNIGPLHFMVEHMDGARLVSIVAEKRKQPAITYGTDGGGL